MTIAIRPLRTDESRMFFDIHTRAIRGLAAAHYPSEVIRDWAGAITERSLERFETNAEQSIRLIAELDGEPAGLGVLVPANAELRACYVVPEAARKGVGSALVREIERIARENGLSRLNLDSSVNAEKFYASLGYEVVTRGERVLGSGVRMAAVQMTKAVC
jgi:putative acetyltransferase